MANIGTSALNAKLLRRGGEGVTLPMTLLLVLKLFISVMFFSVELVYVIFFTVNIVM
jgi:hypothetical protein